MHFVYTIWSLLYGNTNIKEGNMYITSLERIWNIVSFRYQPFQYLNLSVKGPVKSVFTKHYFLFFCVEWIINCLYNKKFTTPNFRSFNEMFVTYTKAENFYKFSRSVVMHTQTHFRPEARENYSTKS